MPKVRFVYTGICTLTPGYPRDTSPPDELLTALMPEGRSGRFASDGTTWIASHLPFIFVPTENVAVDSRGADSILTRIDDQECAVFFLDREELTIAPAPTNAINYVIGTGSLGERPTTSNIDDIRWAADFREINPDHASLRAACLATTDVDPHVAVRIRMDGGTISSRFPCPEGPSATILHATTTIHRQFAQEIVIEMEFASTVTEVTLHSERFDDWLPAAPDLVLQFVDSADFEVLIANGPLESLLNLEDNPCSGHDHAGEVDYEFELYYDVLDYTPGPPLPVPELDAAELQHNDCYCMFVD